MRDQIDRFAVPRLSFTHTAYHLLTLFVIEDVLCEDLCWSIWARVVKAKIEGVEAGRHGIVGEKWETQVIGVFVLLLFIHMVVVNG